MEQREAECIHLLFNNAGIGSPVSFVDGDREEWERVFGVCWYGVYYCARAFVPLLVAGDEGYLVNTSSINGFWASLGPTVPHKNHRCGSMGGVTSSGLKADRRTIEKPAEPELRQVDAGVGARQQPGDRLARRRGRYRSRGR